MLNPRIKEIVSLAYTSLGDIGYSIALNLRKGKDHSSKQKELKNKGKIVRFILKIILRHVDTDTTPPTLYRITKEQVNRLLDCLQKVGRLDTYPIVPTALPQPKPVVFKKGEDGTDGSDGTNGTDANIIVEAAVGETEITVTPVIISDVTHYRIEYNRYTEMIINVSIQGTKIFEKGVIVTAFNLNITTTKGSNNITAITITSHTSLNTTLQGVLNFTAINGVTQPVVNFVTPTNISTNQDYIVQITDGVTTKNDQDSIRFYFPFLYGATDITNPTHYSALTKLIAAQGNKSFIFNGTNKYFWIGYPSSYGVLARIRDQNGFVDTADWTVVIVNVTSIGLDNNYTEEYRFYRSTLKTDINNQPFSIEF